MDNPENSRANESKKTFYNIMLFFASLTAIFPKNFNRVIIRKIKKIGLQR